MHIWLLGAQPGGSMRSARFCRAAESVERRTGWCGECEDPGCWQSGAEHGYYYV